MLLAFLLLGGGPVFGKDKLQRFRAGNLVLGKVIKIEPNKNQAGNLNVKYIIEQVYIGNQEKVGSNFTTPVTREIRIMTEWDGVHYIPNIKIGDRIIWEIGHTSRASWPTVMVPTEKSRIGVYLRSAGLFNSDRIATLTQIKIAETLRKIDSLPNEEEYEFLKSQIDNRTDFTHVAIELIGIINWENEDEYEYLLELSKQHKNLSVASKVCLDAALVRKDEDAWKASEERNEFIKNMFVGDQTNKSLGYSVHYVHQLLSENDLPTESLTEMFNGVIDNKSIKLEQRLNLIYNSFHFFLNPKRVSEGADWMLDVLERANTRQLKGKITHVISTNHGLLSDEQKKRMTDIFSAETDVEFRTWIETNYATMR